MIDQEGRGAYLGRGASVTALQVQLIDTSEELIVRISSCIVENEPMMVRDNKRC